MTASIIQRLWALFAVVLASLATPALAAEVHPGQAVYDRACAACHNAPEPGSRAAPVASLRQMEKLGARPLHQLHLFRKDLA